MAQVLRQAGAVVDVADVDGKLPAHLVCDDSAAGTWEGAADETDDGGSGSIEERGSGGWHFVGSEEEQHENRKTGDRDRHS